MDVKVDNGKYEFRAHAGFIGVLRHGKPWIDSIDGGDAIMSMMAELDASRLVLECVSTLITEPLTEPFDSDDMRCMLRDVLARHKALVGQPMKPSPWARPERLCADGSSGSHEPDCDRQGDKK